MCHDQVRSCLSMHECISNPDDSFRLGVLEPLKLVYDQGSVETQCVVLIDGLCNSELRRPDHGDTVGSFLAKHLQSIPSWLKIVCTVRSSSVPVAAKGLPFHHISLDKATVDERVRKDISDYIGAR